MDPSVGDLNSPHSMGTTIIGVTYNGGVVLGADSRTSTGVYVANRASDKITQLTDNVYVCRSGSAADSQIVSDYVRYFLHQHTIQLGQPATVKVAANLVRLLSYNNKSMLQTGLIIGGWDKYEGGKIYDSSLSSFINHDTNNPPAPLSPFNCHCHRHFDHHDPPPLPHADHQHCRIP
ncbi:hypothetical protein RJ640_007764 [Escallonia rubra]|uniref:Proteasome subunit beta n=1 Tax=Escallonia rubra TaxID=112253 RepID=A0AA88QMS7_9ASTE|nr:hypothetical protein RJ640_007764 [Escallonia rubra]